MSDSSGVLVVDLEGDLEGLELDLVEPAATWRTVRSPFEALLAMRRAAPQAVVVNLPGLGPRERSFVEAASGIRGGAPLLLLLPATPAAGAGSPPPTPSRPGVSIVRKPFVHEELRRLLASSAPPSPSPAAGAAQEGSASAPERDALSRRLELLEGEISWSRALGHRLGNLDGILRLTVEHAIVTVRASRGSIQFLDRYGRELRVSKALGDGSALLEEMVRPATEGIPGRVLELGEAERGVAGIPEADALPDAVREGLRGPYLCVPLRFSGRIFGVLNVARSRGDDPFTPRDCADLEALLARASSYIRNALELAEKERLALVDPLTGLFNRRYFDRQFPKEIRRAQRYGHPITLLILDIDDFKAYNDRNGYLAGDSILKEVAGILRSSFRRVDVVTRWGGEEFAILLPETPKPASEQPGGEGGAPIPYAERVLEAVRRHRFPLGDHQPGGRLTLSGGAATYPDDTQDREELQVLANRALRRAKTLGKDRICVFRAPTGGEEPPPASP